MSGYLIKDTTREEFFARVRKQFLINCVTISTGVQMLFYHLCACFAASTVNIQRKNISNNIALFTHAFHPSFLEFLALHDDK